MLQPFEKLKLQICLKDVYYSLFYYRLWVFNYRQLVENNSFNNLVLLIETNITGNKATCKKFSNKKKERYFGSSVLYLQVLLFNLKQTKFLIGCK